ncbi:MAG: hypothetical protein IKO41_21555 [Lachnospiraceae bacterium]|nr:hypothetical protein [Lachnospiraceae bacterium]
MATLKLGKLYQAGQEFLLRSTDIYDTSVKKTLAQYIADTNTAISGLEAALAGKAPVSIVADIAARDALTNVITGALCWVQDASDDSSVASGAAAYLASVSGDPAVVTWTKVAEAESMDVVLQWANIQGKPSSAVADIDDAVSKKHEHANATVLNGLSADSTSGNLEFNGVELGEFTGISVGSSLAGATDNTTQLQIVVEEYDPEASE